MKPQTTIDHRPSKSAPPARVLRSPKGKEGFTLVETVLALALTAIGLLALLGLIPHGLEVMKTATNISVEARIAQELVGEVMLANWEDIDDEFNDQVRYFDNEGVEVDRELDPDFDVKLTYVARIVIPDPTPASGASDTEGFRLPGFEGADPDMKRVVVHVTNSPFPIDLLDEDIQAQYKKKIHIYASTVTNMTSLKDQEKNRTGTP